MEHPMTELTPEPASATVARLDEHAETWTEPMTPTVEASGPLLVGPAHASSVAGPAKILDTWSSVSSQHYIDAGHYLFTDGTCPCDVPAEAPR
jgi:hypothetical protein